LLLYALDERRARPLAEEDREGEHAEQGDGHPSFKGLGEMKPRRSLRETPIEPAHAAALVCKLTIDGKDNPDSAHGNIVLAKKRGRNGPGASGSKRRANLRGGRSGG